MMFSIKDVFSKSEQIRSFLWISTHLRKTSLMQNFIFLCSVNNGIVNPFQLTGFKKQNLTDGTDIKTFKMKIYL